MVVFKRNLHQTDVTLKLDWAQLDTAGRMDTRWRWATIVCRVEQRNLATSPMQPEQTLWEVKSSTKIGPPNRMRLGLTWQIA